MDVPSEPFLLAHEVAAEGLPQQRALESTRAGSARCRGPRGRRHGPAALQLIWPVSPWLEITWPRVPARREHLLQALLHLTEVNAALVVHVLNAVSFTMELSLSEKHSSTMEIPQRLQSCKSYFLDPHMKALASSLGKDVYDTTRWYKALKLRMATNACREQRASDAGSDSSGSHVGDRSRCDSILWP